MALFLLTTSTLAELQTELQVQLIAACVGLLYPFWSIDFTDISLCPHHQHFTYGPRRSQHCVMHLTSLLIKTAELQCSCFTIASTYGFNCNITRNSNCRYRGGKKKLLGKAKVQVTHRGCAVSIPEGFQDPTG